MNQCSTISRFLGKTLVIAVLVVYGVLPCAPATSAASAPIVQRFYTSTVDAYTAWVAGTSAPPPSRTAVFPAGTAVITCYLAYAHATPKVTSLQLAIYDAAGKLYAYTARFTASYVNGLAMRKLAPHAGGTYAAGSYTAYVWLDRRPSLSTSFRVGPSSSAQPTAVPTIPPAKQPAWLVEINRYRVAAGVAPVTDQPKWDLALEHHLRYLAKTPARYRTGEYASDHEENPASPYYTADGADAGESNIVHDYVNYSNVYVIDVWLTAPFHGQVMLDPRLRQVAFAYDPSTGYGALDVVHGYDYNMSRTTTAVLFPAPGMTTNLSRMLSTETPDPLVSCGWQGKKVGLPLIVRLAQAPSNALHAEITGPMGLRESSRAGNICIVDGTTLRLADSGEQTGYRGFLRDERLVFLIPRLPLTTGTYHASITQPGQSAIRWSFRVQAQ